MPQVSLDGLQIEVTHARAADEVSKDLERMARELATSRFSEWQVTVEREGEAVRLRGARDATRFEAVLTSVPGLVRVSLTGGVELGFVKLGLAGGAPGVRERVRSSVADTLRGFLQ